MSKKPPKPKAKRMNARQGALLKNLAKGMTQKDAAIAAGYTPKHPGKAAHQALELISRNWPDELERVVGTKETVIEKYLLPLMNATERKAFNHNGEIVYSKPMVAWGPRYNGLDTYFRVAGAYAKEIELNAQVGVKVVLVDIPRPARGVVMADVGPGALPSSNGHKPTDK